MDSKRLLRQMGTALMLAALAMSCAPGGDMENTEFLDPNKQLSSNLKGETLTYNGIWTVDGLAAETVNAYVKIDDTSEISFDSYPYQTIVSRMFPNMKVSSVSHVMPPSLTFRLLGYSDNAIYLENSSEVYDHMFFLSSAEISFIVHEADGSETPFRVLFTANRTVATVDNYHNTFTLVLSVYCITSGTGDGETVKELNPEMTLKFTSTKRIK